MGILVRRDTPIAPRPPTSSQTERGPRAHLLSGPVTLVTPDGERRLETEVVIIGRAPENHIQIIDPLISRRHLRITVTQAAAVAEDLRSANGVYINGERIHRSRPLCDGDRILIGTSELSVFGAAFVPRVRESIQPKQELARISSGALSAVRESSLREELDPELRQRTESNSTARASAFEVLGRLADRMLTVGRIAEAERVLGEHLVRLLDGARAGLPVPEEVRLGATRYALRLAAATKRVAWYDYVFELHTLADVPIPLENLASITATAPLAELDAEGCRDYLVRLEREVSRSPAEVIAAHARLRDFFGVPA